jgi:hypothetical protein
MLLLHIFGIASRKPFGALSYSAANALAQLKS